MIATRRQPDCGHKQLIECPLTVEDWHDVFTAYLGFRYQCLLISERAHSRRAPSDAADTDQPRALRPE